MNLRGTVLTLTAAACGGALALLAADSSGVTYMDRKHDSYFDSAITRCA